MTARTWPFASGWRPANCWRYGPDEIDKEKLKDELADVFYSAFLLADTYGLDVGKIVRGKLGKNAKKYPVSKSRGSRKKYDEL
jgi:NTP pyrophosphatase (non-canonical NTP hydrolase)